MKEIHAPFNLLIKIQTPEDIKTNDIFLSIVNSDTNEIFFSSWIIKDDINDFPLRIILASSITKGLIQQISKTINNNGEKQKCEKQHYF